MAAGKESDFNVFLRPASRSGGTRHSGFAALIPPTKYLALYWAKTADPGALKQAAAAAQLSFTKSPAFDTNATRGYTFRAIGLLVEGERVRAARANKNK